MSTKRLWLIAGSAVALVVVLIVMANLFAPKESRAVPTPTATAPASAPPAPTNSATPAPTPTPSATATAPPDAGPTCDDIATTVFRSMMASNGWVSWQTQDQPTGSRPFDAFYNGTPPGAVICRWGADPQLATDNVSDLAWAPIDPENAVDAMLTLAQRGFTRIDAVEGVYLAAQGPAGHTDAEGWGETYFFTPKDVRWAVTKADVMAYVKSPVHPD
ncbi:hypothetical protein NQ152_08435 [Microbacterium sp. zg.B48]|uniref:hypothetical protein n=1 Tax=unclassified Microbacterium TaxID=2609290 RepID=UPI00214CA621|nr:MULTISPECIES: hypothetical protein [unclassified Microbacterium]MCR2763537.1 hypothetical protein [Microbacterium sp. zg.B48]MCR2809258.1 hypothetical protein [Microbacterium sp. zg.B185]WIM20401.1 hypothetical protein QNO12_06280 [Microbacterium sp. zg-B185]